MSDSKECKVEVYIEGLTTYVLGSRCGETIGDIRSFLNLHPQEEIAEMESYNSLSDDIVITKDMNLWIIPETRFIPISSSEIPQSFVEYAPSFEQKTLLPTYQDSQIDEIHKNVDLIKSLITEEDLKEITSQSTRKEWEDFFGPVINNLQKQIKKRIYKLMEDKVILEAQVNRLTNSFECPEYTIDQAIEKIENSDIFKKEYYRKIYDQHIKTLKINFLTLERKKENPIDIFMNIFINHGDNSYQAQVRFFIITQKNVYSYYYSYYRDWQGVFTSWISNGIYDMKLYSFKESLDQSRCRMLKSFCKIPLIFVSHDNYRNGIDSESKSYSKTMIDTFEDMIKSIPGTYYHPLKSHWIERETLDGNIEYFNKQTLESTNEPQYENPPEEYN